MKIHSFTNDPVLTEAFISFGYEIYQDDSRWIPPFREVLVEQLSSGRGLARGPGDDMRHFVAMSGTKVVGRVSAMANSALHSNDAPVGAVGFFECVDDVETAGALFDAAQKWLADEHGIDQVWGPMNFDIWHDYRLMTRGFGRAPFGGEPYNKAYYPSLFERCGWDVVKKWESVDLDRHGIEQVIDWGEARYRRTLASGYRFRDPDPRRFEDELKILHGILTESFSGFLGFTPITQEDFVREYSVLSHALVPGWFTFVDDPDGNLAGFCGAFLDLADARRAMKGNTDLVARLKFAWHRRRARRAVFYIVGLTQAEATSGSGVGRAAVCHSAHGMHADGISSVTAALMAADGRTRSRVAGRNTPPAQREYALYGIQS